MSLEQFDVDGLPTVWYRRLTEGEWRRIEAKAPEGPGEAVSVSEVVLGADETSRLHDLVAGEDDPVRQRGVWALWIDSSPRRRRV